jgi:hypothetical protein
MDSGASNRRRHLGVDFAMWKNDGTWFWLLIDSNGEGATIGASANEAQALHDAWHSIEEKLTQF